MTATTTRPTITVCPQCKRQWLGRFPSKARYCIRCGHEFAEKKVKEEEKP